MLRVFIDSEMSPHEQEMRTCSRIGCQLFPLKTDFFKKIIAEIGSNVLCSDSPRYLNYREVICKDSFASARRAKLSITSS